MIVKKLFLLASVAVLLSACAIRQRVTAPDRFAEREICVIENPAVKVGFLDSYRKALAQKGYDVRVVPASAALNECTIMSTYSANWRWDLATYMVYAQIKIYVRTKPTGVAEYDATRGGANMGKFISADNKITELVNQLLPGGAGS